MKMPMANQDSMTGARRTPFILFVTGRLPLTAVRASSERPSPVASTGADPSCRSVAEEHRRSSGVDRGKTEREPARTMHLAWFAGAPGRRTRNVCVRRTALSSGMGDVYMGDSCNPAEGERSHDADGTRVG